MPRVALQRVRIPKETPSRVTKSPFSHVPEPVSWPSRAIRLIVSAFDAHMQRHDPTAQIVNINVAETC